MFGFEKMFAGLEITTTSVRMAQVLKGKRSWRLISCKEVALPDEALELSYKNENILDPSGFQSAVKEVLKSAKGHVMRVGLSLPNEVVKIALHKFDELPRARDSIKQLIGWKEKTTLPFPVENASIAYSVFPSVSSEEKRLLVSIGFQDIIRDYERNLKGLRVNPEVIQPSAINQINFYMERIPSDGISAFLGVFENYFTFFVFEEGGLIFFRGKRRSRIPVHFLQEIDMTLELYLTENPGREMDTLYLACQFMPSVDFEKEITEYFDMNIEMLNEEEIIPLNDPLENQDNVWDVASYAAAIGAAQSLVR